MKNIRKRLAFIFVVSLVTVFAYGFRTVTSVIGLRSADGDADITSCGIIPVASADVPYAGEGEGSGEGGEGCEGGEGEGGEGCGE